MVGQHETLITINQAKGQRSSKRASAVEFHLFFCFQFNRINFSVSEPSVVDEEVVEVPLLLLLDLPQGFTATCENTLILPQPQMDSSTVLTL